MDQVLKPLIDAGLVEMTIPDNQRSKQESRMPGGGKNPNSGTSRTLPRRKSEWRSNGGVNEGVSEGISLKAGKAKTGLSRRRVTP